VVRAPTHRPAPEEQLDRDGRSFLHGPTDSCLITATISNPSDPQQHVLFRSDMTRCKVHAPWVIRTHTLPEPRLCSRAGVARATEARDNNMMDWDHIALAPYRLGSVKGG
jgi:hypothetical protein